MTYVIRAVHENYYMNTKQPALVRLKEAEKFISPPMALESAKFYYRKLGYDFDYYANHYTVCPFEEAEALELVESVVNS